jgi:hypothetical protein
VKSVVTGLWYPWVCCPLYAIYTAAVAFVFMRRGNFGWSAVAFVMLGLLIPPAWMYGVWWWLDRLVFRLQHQ